MGEKLVGLCCGIAFGFVLGWAQLADPAVMHRMLRLEELDLFLLLGSAMVTSAAGVHLLRALRARALLPGTPVSWSVARPERKHVLGSVLFGLGWSIACTCPGPLAAQIGRGQFAGFFTAAGLLGGIAAVEAMRKRATRPAPAPVPEAVGL